jgi:hypothetical protein
VNDPPPGLLLNVLDAPGAKATVLHLVNYRFEYGDGFSDPKVVPAKDVVLCARMTGEPPRVHLLTADAEPRVLALEKRADAWLVRVPEVGIYGAVVVGGD